jgi:threonine/homoserine/homoserine lactone efflux protein
MLAGVSFARLLGRPLISRIANIAFAVILVAATVAAVLH